MFSSFFVSSVSSTSPSLELSSKGSSLFFFFALGLGEGLAGLVSSLSVFRFVFVMVDVIKKLRQIPSRVCTRFYVRGLDMA